MSEIVNLEKIAKTFITPIETITVLKDLDFQLSLGDRVSVMGPSGSGKSTFLNILGLLESATDGTYRFLDQDTKGWNSRQCQECRLTKIGFVFQTFNLIPTLTVVQNIELPMALMHISQGDQNKKSKLLMEQFDITTKSERFPHQLSIGEQQRVAIARALVNDPSLLLCDEPTGNLDAKNAEIVFDFLDQISGSQVAMVIVSHNPATQRICNRNLSLKDGQLHEN